MPAIERDSENVVFEFLKFHAVKETPTDAANAFQTFTNEAIANLGSTATLKSYDAFSLPLCYSERNNICNEFGLRINKFSGKYLSTFLYEFVLVVITAMNDASTERLPVTVVVL